MTDEEITKAARAICAAQAAKSDSPQRTLYRSGAWDHTVWMRLVERGIRRGLKGQAMVKTQHCPNCEATEQKLHDFQQKVSDAVENVIESCAVTSWGAAMLDPLIIPKPKPDPLVEVMRRLGWYNADTDAADLRVTLDDFGLEIRSKNDGQ